MEIDVVCARDGLAEDELKNHILRLIRQGSQTLTISIEIESINASTV
jgi:ParB family chromosome partitioning protein